MHFFDDEAGPHALVEKLMAALPSGSYLVVSHVTADHEPQRWAEFVELMRRQGMPTHPRSRDEVARFFTGLEPVAPGVVPLLRWRPPAEDTGLTDAQVALYGGVGRKS
nr:SAM-dependent methyltransferase [uncultured Actinoplanes sp.]